MYIYTIFRIMFITEGQLCTYYSLNRHRQDLDRKYSPLYCINCYLKKKTIHDDSFDTTVVKPAHFYDSHHDDTVVEFSLSYDGHGTRPS